MNIQEDYIKSLTNPAHGIEKYMQTFDMTQKATVDLKLFPRQKYLVECLSKYRFNIVTKPRQAGISTVTAAYLALRCSLATADNAEKILIVANKLKQAKEFLSKIRDFLKFIPKQYWGENYNESKETEGYVKGTGSTEHLRLVNGCEVVAKATSPDALRGYTPTHIVIDEAAFIDRYAEKLYQGTVAAVSTGGNITIISTPNGHDPLYYEVYKNAIAGQNDYHVIEMRWYQDPRYNKQLEWHKQDKQGNIEVIKEQEFTLDSYESMVKRGFKPTSPWYRSMCKNYNNNKLMIARELDVEFEGSSNTIVDSEVIKEQRDMYCMEPILEEHKKKYFAYPKDGYKYVIGVDVASGLGDDFSTIVVYCTDTKRVVFTYKDKCKPSIFSEVVREIGEFYNGLIVVDETGGYGSHVIQHLIDAKMEELLYYEEKELEKKQQGKPCRAGIKITGANRNKIIFKGVEYIEDYDVLVSDIRLITEMQTFVMVNGRADHKDGSNDDALFALFLAIWGFETAFKSLQISSEATKTKINILNYAAELKKSGSTGMKQKASKKEAFKSVSDKIFRRTNRKAMQQEQNKRDAQWLLG